MQLAISSLSIMFKLFSCQTLPLVESKKQIIESHVVNGSNYVRITEPSVPFNSIFIFNDSNSLRVCSFVVFNSKTVKF